MGLRFVKGLGNREWDRIATLRKNGSFRSTADFVQRARLSEKALAALAANTKEQKEEVRAFNFIGQGDVVDNETTEEEPLLAPALNFEDEKKKIA